MKMKKIVLTGAAGRLGSYLREPLSKMANQLLSTDISNDIGSLYDNETFVKADLAEMSEIKPLMKDADMVVHFGAYVDEGPFEKLWGPNFIFPNAMIHFKIIIIYRKVLIRWTACDIVISITSHMNT